MNDEPALFDITDAPNTRHLRREPAPWVENHGLSGYRYGCRCTTCTASKKDRNTLDAHGLRRCQHCGTTYPKDTGGGTKFCADCLKAGVYKRNDPSGPVPEVTCIRCTQTYRGRTKRWNLCTTCTSDPIFRSLSSSLANHHAPADLVLTVMDWPYCANEQCGAFLLEQVQVTRFPSHGKRWRGNWTIDHDHACCPGDNSCGRCIRGILCRRCNHMLITDQVHILNGLASYLHTYAS